MTTIEKRVATTKAQISDPIPTLLESDLMLSLGEGRWITAEIEPLDRLEAVELRWREPGESAARVAHGPFRFFLPKSSRGRRLCIIATYAGGDCAEACVVALE